MGKSWQGLGAPIEMFIMFDEFTTGSKVKENVHTPNLTTEH